MLLQLFRSPHRKTCIEKQKEREDRIAALPSYYRGPLTVHDNSLLSTPLADLVKNVKSGSWKPTDVLRAYAKKALIAHEKTNCFTEVLISDAEKWAKACELKGPLAGVPVSLKDSCAVAGYDSTIGFSGNAFKPLRKDGPLVQLLKDAGAIPFVKTAIPITLMSFECANDVWGVCKNPYKVTHSPGGSTGGESALLALGGSRIGIGTDVAGSVRIPAHFCGIYSIKSSIGRFPKQGPTTSMPGQEGVPAICAPMSRTLEDLEVFWKAIVGMKPWNYDHSCYPIPWRDITLPKRVKWGVMWDDGVIAPSPACRRALSMTVKALKAKGDEVVEFMAPSPAEGFILGLHLIFADGGHTVMKPFRWFETNDSGAATVISFLRKSLWLKKIYAFFIRYLYRDPFTADLIAGCHEKTTQETWQLVTKREAYRVKWFEAWQEQGIDFLLTVPNATPAIPHGGMKDCVTSVGYTFLFNILDYAAGVLPVTHVDAKLDALPSSWKPRNIIEKRAYKQYNSYGMAGLPVGVQVAGRRLEEEKVLEGMKAVQDALREQGILYKGLTD